MRVDPDAEIFRLRGVLRDLVALSAIPAAWTATNPRAVATGLADELVELLQLDFAFVRLCDPDGAGAVEVTSGDAWKRFPEWLESHLATSVQFSFKEIFPDVGGGAELCRGIAIRIGVNGEEGVVAVASERSDFPTATDQLLLSLAANQAATAFRSSCLIQERRRAEEELREARNELEMKVAEQTADLRRSEAYLAQLAEEQAALRRVATLVARGAPPEELFAAVVNEVGRVLSVDLASMGRYESDGTITWIAKWGTKWGRAHENFPVGTRQRLGGKNLGTIVFETGRSARIDNYADSASGPLGAAGREAGINSALATPIMVEGRLWGWIAAGSIRKQPLPADTESRLENFTELVVTAISNVQARSELVASRVRIVEATDEERRRVVRDLHDGAQSRLIHTVIALERAKAVAGDAGPVVEEGLAHAHSAIDELRELAHGIHPAILTNSGLAAAIEVLADRAPLPVHIEIPEERYPTAVESAAYFVVAEALTNVAKHARAGHAGVTARVEDGTLRVEVRDDGVGGARPDSSGLLGLADRLAVLDGRLRVESPADGGTLIAATIPFVR